MSEPTREAERAGGNRQVNDVYWLKTSQYDHSTNTFRSKKLSERCRVFGDGRGGVQRDLYSAFLARNSEGSTHHPLALEKAAHGLASLLQHAAWHDTKLQEADLELPLYRLRGPSERFA